MPLAKERLYTSEDYWNLPDGQRAELIDGQICDMVPPGYIHQKLVMELSATIRDHIRKNAGSCEVLPAPFAVNLNADDRTYVEPDISVICSWDKITEKGCKGAPDVIIEVVSPGSQRMDYQIKLFRYRTAGVREYWIVNPATKTVTVYGFEKDEHSGQYSFDDHIQMSVFPGLRICIADLL
ncbi:MAG: Uma2 family endonuclease [Lachnospiraceae bacterium]|nr:Uma2 family endonuclease [Lachnospiraceae bacterium]